MLFKFKQGFGDAGGGVKIVFGAGHPVAATLVQNRGVKQGAFGFGFVGQGSGLAKGVVAKLCRRPGRCVDAGGGKEITLRRQRFLQLALVFRGGAALWRGVLLARGVQSDMAKRDADMRACSRPFCLSD